MGATYQCGVAEGSIEEYQHPLNPCSYLKFENGSYTCILKGALGDLPVNLTPALATECSEKNSRTCLCLGIPK